MTCDPYVYRNARRWAWNCPCGATATDYQRRMDADVAAEAHVAESR